MDAFIAGIVIVVVTGVLVALMRANSLKPRRRPLRHIDAGDADLPSLGGDHHDIGSLDVGDY